MEGFQLEWKEHNKALCSRLWNLFKEQCMVDFGIRCRGQYYNAHKVIMSLFCPMSITAQELNFDNLAAHEEDLRYLFEFIYCGKATVPEDHAECLMRIAKTIGLEELITSLVAEGVSSNDDGSTLQSIETKESDLPSKSVKKNETRRSQKESKDNGSVSSGSEEEEEDSETSVESDETLEDESHETVRVRSTSNKKRTTLKKEKKEFGPMKGQSTKKKRPRKKKISSETDEEDDSEEGEEEMFELINPEEESRKKTTRELEKKYECKYCELKACNPVLITQHMLIRHRMDEHGNKLKKNVHCHLCKHVTYSNLQLNSHLLDMHRNETNFKCDRCDFTTIHRSSMNRHKRKVHQITKSVKCIFCAVHFDTKEELDGHVSMIHKEKKCSFCQADYTVSLEFERYKPCDGDQTTTTKLVCKNCKYDPKYISERSFKCMHCDYKQRQKNVYLEHLASRHKVDGDGKPLELNIRCSECNFACSTEKQLHTHSIIKHIRLIRARRNSSRKMSSGTEEEEEEDSEIEIIDSVESDEESDRGCKKRKNFVRNRTKTAKNDKKTWAECKYCDYKTSRGPPSVRLHVTVKHQLDNDGNPLEKNVKCPHCEYVTYSKHQIRRHIRDKHLLEKKFKCKECTFTTQFKDALVRHDRLKHQHRRDFKCPICEAGFQRSGTRNAHVRIQHEGIKPHKCHICSAGYSTKDAFVMHMQSHEGKVFERFKCHMCKQRFKWRRGLKVHLMKVHETEMERIRPKYQPRSSCS